MSGFRYLSLDYWKRLAGLDSEPPFLHVIGDIQFGYSEYDNVDARYFSPAALHWEAQALEYLADGFHLRGNDGHLLLRIGAARRLGHEPSYAQRLQFAQAMKYRAVEKEKPYALEREAMRLGLAWGPDYEWDEEDEPPQLPSARELAFKDLAPEWDLSPESLKRSFYQSWRKDHDAVFGTH